MTRLVVSLVLLTLLYALVLTSLNPWDLAAGVLISAVCILLFRRFLFTESDEPRAPFFRRLVAFLPFLWAVTLEVIRGTWQVMLVALHLRPLSGAGIIAVPIGERTPSGITVTALVVTLSPGSVLIDVDYDQGVMLFHLLDVGDPEATRRSYQQFYDRYQRLVFP